MSKDQPPVVAAGGITDPLAEAEASLGHALALIHRALPRLDEPGWVADVQAALQKAGGCLESARLAHQRGFGPGRAASVGTVHTRVEAETVAIISAAIAAIFDRPYRLVSVQPVVAQVPHLNVWALEGRTQIFQSHKIR
jgi:hypothetical protein